MCRTCCCGSSGAGSGRCASTRAGSTGWDPPSFVVTAAEIDRAAAATDGELAAAIAFAQAQVRGFAAHSGPRCSTSRSRRCRACEQATVAYGDKAVGTNHVLPTSGAARYTGGLWVGKFLKTVTYQRLTEDGTRRVAPAVAAISHAEGFEGHAITAEMRLGRAVV
jgi:histidinol dehydrogenase